MTKEKEYLPMCLKQKSNDVIKKGPKRSVMIYTTWFCIRSAFSRVQMSLFHLICKFNPYKYKNNSKTVAILNILQRM